MDPQPQPPGQRGGVGQGLLLALQRGGDVLPGQTVTFRDGSVLVDGETLEEPYLPAGTETWPGTSGDTFTVPEGCVFLLGDNRNNSMDSRYPDLGPVDVRCVIGKAVVLVFPGKTAETGKRDFGRIGGL